MVCQLITRKSINEHNYRVAKKYKRLEKMNFCYVFSFQNWNISVGFKTDFSKELITAYICVPPCIWMMFIIIASVKL